MRAREVVRAVRIEHGAVMLNLEKEVVDHALGKRFAVVRFESEKDEEAVPAVHLIEASAGYDVRIGQVEQASRRKLLRAEVSQLLDALRKACDLHVTFFPERRDIRRGGCLGRHVKDWICRDLDIHERMTVSHRARERVPRAMNVLKSGGRIRRSGDCARRGTILSTKGGRTLNLNCGYCKEQRTNQLHTNSSV